GPVGFPIAEWRGGSGGGGGHCAARVPAPIIAALSATASEPFVTAGPGGWRGRSRKPPDALVPPHRTPCSFRPSAAARHLGATGAAVHRAFTETKAGVTAQIDHSQYNVSDSLMRGPYLPSVRRSFPPHTENPSKTTAANPRIPADVVPSIYWIGEIGIE